MYFREIPGTSLRVSAVGMGTWAMGNDFWGAVDDGECIAAIKAGIDRGITLIDTAPAYGSGHAEELVGKAIAGRRDEVVLATKVGVQKGTHDAHVDLRPHAIRREVDESLQRLNVDTIDLYQMHWPDPNTALDDSLDALNRIREQGKVRYLGVSNFGLRMLERTVERGHIVGTQNHYSLLRRDIERDIVPFALDHGMATFTYGTLGGGVLTGKYEGIPRFDSQDKRAKFYDFFHEPLWSTIKKFLEPLKEIAEANGKPVSEIVINWTLWQPGITSVLVGARNPSQAISNAEAGSWELTNDELDEIDSYQEQLFASPQPAGT